MLLLQLQVIYGIAQTSALPTANPAAPSTDPPTATNAGLTASPIAPSTDHITAPPAAPTAPSNLTSATTPATIPADPPIAPSAAPSTAPSIAPSNIKKLPVKKRVSVVQCFLYSSSYCFVSSCCFFCSSMYTPNMSVEKNTNFENI